jgi:hypothetical protein
MVDSQENEPDWRISTRSRFVFGEPPDLFADVEQLLSSLPFPMREVVQNFRANIRSAFTVASIPFTVAHQTVTSRRFQMVRAAESIRRLPIPEPGGDQQSVLTPELEREALASAETKFRAFVLSDEGSRVIPNEILRELQSALQDTDFASASKELLRQTLASVWDPSKSSLVMH